MHNLFHWLELGEIMPDEFLTKSTKSRENHEERTIIAVLRGFSAYFVIFVRNSYLVDADTTPGW